MKILRKLMAGIGTAWKRLSEWLDKKYGLRRVAVIAGAVVTAWVVGITAGVANASSGSQKVRQKEEKQVQAQEVIAPVLAEEKPKIESQVSDAFLNIVKGVDATRASNGEYHPIGTDGEAVLVGQRTVKREEVDQFEAGWLVEESVNAIDDKSWGLVQKTMMSDKDYDTLLAIVEAEAGGEDMEGRIMVANVIFNRVYSDKFPDTVTEVVWDQSGGSPQFSPTADGRIHTVTVSDSTREAVNRAIDGEDYSQGALFFLQREYSTDKNVAWFDKNLKFLFQHGVHSFYTY